MESTSSTKEDLLQKRKMESPWQKIESTLEKTPAGYRVKDETDIRKISENFHRLMTETSDADGRLIKPSEIVRAVTGKPEESTKLLFTHWLSGKDETVQKPKLTKKLKVRFECLEELARQSGESAETLKLRMFEGTSYLPPQKSSSPVGAISLADVLNGLSEKIITHHGLKEYFEKYYSYSFRGDPSRRDQLYRDADTYMDEDRALQTRSLTVNDGAKEELDLTWAFPRVTLGRFFGMSYVGLLCIDKKASVPNQEFGYEGQNIGTNAAHSDTDFSVLTNVNAALARQDLFECFPVVGRSVTEYNWVIVPGKQGECAGAFEIRYGDLFERNWDTDFNHPVFQLTPEINKGLGELPENVVMRNFSQNLDNFVEVEGYQEGKVHKAKILVFPKEMIASSPDDWEDPSYVQWEFDMGVDQGEDRKLEGESISRTSYDYVNEDSILRLQDALTRTGPLEAHSPEWERPPWPEGGLGYIEHPLTNFGELTDYLGETTFPVWERPGWHASPVNAPADFADVSNYGGDVKEYTPAGDAVEGYPINTFLHRLENNLADTKRREYCRTVVDLLNHDARVKTANFGERCRQLTEHIDQKRHAIVEGFSPESALPKEIKE